MGAEASEPKGLFARRWVLLGAFILALVLRLWAWGDILQDGRIYFDGPDSYYHVKRIRQTVTQFPAIPSFDPDLNYPYGASVLWPPLFDWFLALISLVVGGGHPSPFLVEATAAIFPALLGALSVFPAFWLGRAIFSEPVGRWSACFLAILPAHIDYSNIGKVDQHVAEGFLAMTSFAALIMALRRGGRPRVWGLLAGAALAMALIVWQGSVVFVGILALFGVGLPFVCPASRRWNWAGWRKLAVIWGLAIVCPSLIALLIMGLPRAPFSYIVFSWFQPLFTLLAGFVMFVLGGVILLFLRQERSLHRLIWIPILILALGLSWLVVPSAFWQSMGEGLLYPAKGGMRTKIDQGALVSYDAKWLRSIKESQPLISGWRSLHEAETQLSRVIYLFPLLLPWLSFSLTRRQPEHRSAIFLLLLLTLVTGTLTLFHQRYRYLFAYPCAVFLAFLLNRCKHVLIRWRRTASENQNALGTLVLGAVFLLLLAPLLDHLPDLGEATTIADSDLESTLQALSELAARDGESQRGAVLAPWSLGHYIGYLAERPVVADNFGHGVEATAHFFLSEDEGEALRFLQERRVQYVVVTDIHQEIPRLSSLVGLLPDQYVREVQLSAYQKYIPQSSYFQTMQARLYDFTGSGFIEGDRDIPGLSRFRLVYESQGRARPSYRAEVDRFQIYTVVPGAEIEGTATAGMPVLLTIELSTPTGRRSYQRLTVSAEDGLFRFRVPYSTELTGYPVRAAGRYQIEWKGNSVEVEVTEADVLQGRLVTVPQP